MRKNVKLINKFKKTMKEDKKKKSNMSLSKLLNNSITKSKIVKQLKKTKKPCYTE
jgi:hypothetical protein